MGLVVLHTVGSHHARPADAGTANIIEHMAGLSKWAGPGGWNDPDFLMPGYWWLSEDEQITEFSFWCLWAAPLIVATDVRVLSNKQIILNKEAIAVNQDKVRIGCIRIRRTEACSPSFPVHGSLAYPEIASPTTAMVGKCGRNRWPMGPGRSSCTTQTSWSP